MDTISDSDVQDTDLSSSDPYQDPARCSPAVFRPCVVSFNYGLLCGCTYTSIAPCSPFVLSGVIVSGSSICSSLALPLLLLDSFLARKDFEFGGSFDEFRLDSNRGVDM